MARGKRQFLISILSCVFGNHVRCPAVAPSESISGPLKFCTLDNSDIECWLLPKVVDMLLLRFKEAVLQLEVEIPNHASEYQAHLSPSVVIGLSEKPHRLVGKAYPISIPIQFRGPIENDWTISPLSGANVASPHLSDRQVSG